MLSPSMEHFDHGLGFEKYSRIKTDVETQSTNLVDPAHGLTPMLIASVATVNL